MAEWRSLHDLLAADSERVWDAIGASREYTGLPMKDAPKPDSELTPEQIEREKRYQREYSNKNRYDTCECGARKRTVSKLCRSCSAAKANRERRQNR